MPGQTRLEKIEVKLEDVSDAMHKLSSSVDSLIASLAERCPAHAQRLKKLERVVEEEEFAGGIKGVRKAVESLLASRKFMRGSLTCLWAVLILILGSIITKLFEMI